MTEIDVLTGLERDVEAARREKHVAPDREVSASEPIDVLPAPGRM